MGEREREGGREGGRYRVKERGRKGRKDRVERMRNIQIGKNERVQ